MEETSILSPERASSCTSTTSSITFEKDMDRLLIMTPSAWKGLKDRNSDEKPVVETKKLHSPPGLDIFNDTPEEPSFSLDPQARSGLPRSRSQPRVGITKGTGHLFLTSIPDTYTLCHEQQRMVESVPKLLLLQNFHQSKLPPFAHPCHRTYEHIHPTRAYPHRRRRRRIFLISTSWPPLWLTRRRMPE